MIFILNAALHKGHAPACGAPVRRGEPSCASPGTGITSAIGALPAGRRPSSSRSSARYSCRSWSRSPNKHSLSYWRLRNIATMPTSAAPKHIPAPINWTTSTARKTSSRPVNAIFIRLTAPNNTVMSAPVPGLFISRQEYHTFSDSRLRYCAARIASPRDIPGLRRTTTDRVAFTMGAASPLRLLGHLTRFVDCSPQPPPAVSQISLVVLGWRCVLILDLPKTATHAHRRRRHPRNRGRHLRNL